MWKALQCDALWGFLAIMKQMDDIPAPHYIQTSRKLPRFRRWLPWTLLAGFLAAVCLAPLEEMRSLCVSRNLTGVPCPTCGVGRSLHALLHFRIGDSLYFHPLLLPYLLGTVGLVMYHKRRVRINKPLSAWFWVTVVAMASIVALAVWYYRMTNGLIP